VDVNQQQWARLVCRETVDSDTVRRLATQHWFLWNRIERDENQPLVYEWQNATKDCRIRFTDDHRLGVRWIDFIGPKAEEVAAFVKSILSMYERAEILELASSAKDENYGIWAAFRLAVLVNGTGFDPEAFGAFGELANHRSPRVREATIYAMSQAGWPQFAGLLEPMAEDDPEEAVRMRASLALQSLPK
jgi:HEAT repeats